MGCVPSLDPLRWALLGGNQSPTQHQLGSHPKGELLAPPRDLATSTPQAGGGSSAPTPHPPTFNKVSWPGGGGEGGDAMAVTLFPP